MAHAPRVPVPLARMRLYPTRFLPHKHGDRYTEPERHFYVSCFVFATRDDMNRWGQRNGFRTGGQWGFEATTAAVIVRSYRKPRRRGAVRVSGEFCQLLAYKGALGTEILCHEFTHVALAYARRRGIAQPTRQECDTDPHHMQREEVVCYAAGSLMRQFVNRAYALHLYD